MPWETKGWWSDVLSYWTPEPVIEYRKDVDQNELVAVAEFGTVPASEYLLYYFNGYVFLYDFNRPKLMKVARHDNEEIGFMLHW
jgi:hypothetical protein